MSTTSLEQILSLIDEELDYEKAIHPKYLEVSKRENELFPSPSPLQAAHLTAAAASASPTASAVTAPPVRGFTKMSHMMQSLNQLTGGGAPQQSTSTRAYPEISGDPALFRFPLIPAESPWDAAKAVEGGRADPFVARLPNFSLGTPGSCNTLVIRGEYYNLPGYDRVFAAVNIGEDASSSTASSVAGQSNLLRNDVLAHCSIRIDPEGGGGGGGGLRYKFIQSYKQNGRWDTTCAFNKVVKAQTLWPLKEKKPFYLRITIEPRGVFTYLDGNALGFVPHHPNWSVSRNNNLVVQLPVSGDAGEKVTWTILGMWWGSCSIDSSGEKVFRNLAQNLSQQKVQVAVPGELFVTGLKDTAREMDLRDAFRAWEPTEVRMGGVVGGATVVLKDASRVPECISTTNKRLSVLGSVVSVTQALKSVPALQAISAHIGPSAPGGLGLIDGRSPATGVGQTSASGMTNGSGPRSPYSM
jgi:hypothetical protein